MRTRGNDKTDDQTTINIFLEVDLQLIFYPPAPKYISLMT